MELWQKVKHAKIVITKKSNIDGSLNMITGGIAF